MLKIISRDDRWMAPHGTGVLSSSPAALPPCSRIPYASPLLSLTEPIFPLGAYDNVVQAAAPSAAATTIPLVPGPGYPLDMANNL